METNILDDGSYYVKICSLDGKRMVQFFIIRVDNKRHRDQLREKPINNDREDF